MLDAIARQMLYPAPRVRVPSPPPAPLTEVRLPLSTGDTALAWRSEPAGLAVSAPLVVFFHGNGENLETLRGSGLFEELGRCGAATLAIDFPGYGRSTGQPSEAGLLACGTAAVEWAAGEPGSRSLVLCGWSLGAAVAVATAAAGAEGVHGLIALSPWTTLAEVARGLFPSFVVDALVSEHYDSLAAAPAVRVPALVAHGERDELIPVEQGRRIAEALSGTTRWVPVAVAGHNDLLARRVVWDEIQRFLRSLPPVHGGIEGGRSLPPVHGGTEGGNQ
jgi:hypothetical protein